jgi:hypothetical protein
MQMKQSKPGSKKFFRSFSSRSLISARQALNFNPLEGTIIVSAAINKQLIVSEHINNVIIVLAMASYRKLQSLISFIIRSCTKSFLLALHPGPFSLPLCCKFLLTLKKSTFSSISGTK